MWLECRTHQLSNCRADRRSDMSVDTIRNDNRGTDLNASAFGEPIVERDRLTKPDRGLVCAGVLRRHR